MRLCGKYCTGTSASAGSKRGSLRENECRGDLGSHGWLFNLLLFVKVFGDGGAADQLEEL